MGAASDAIREGIFQKYQALEKAGVNDQEVEFSLLISETNSAPALGVKGSRVEHRFRLTPTPQVEMKRRFIPTAVGIVPESDATLKGAFPKELKGHVYNDNSKSSPKTKTYKDPASFLADLEKAVCFYVNGERFIFAGTVAQGQGFINVDKNRSEWTVKLIRAEKQS